MIHNIQSKRSLLTRRKGHLVKSPLKIQKLKLMGYDKFYHLSTLLTLPLTCGLRDLHKT